MTELSPRFNVNQDKKIKDLITQKIYNTNRSIDLINAPNFERLSEYINNQFAAAKIQFNLEQAIQNLYEGIMGIITKDNQRIFYFKDKVDSDLIQEYHIPQDIENIKIYNHLESLKIIVLSFKSVNENLI